jgi:hypothetical protein
VVVAKSSPAGSGKLTGSKVVVQSAPVVTTTEPRKCCPSPNPLGSHCPFEKNSRRNIVLATLSSVPTVLEEVKRRVERNEIRPPSVAIIYAALNDRDHAFEWIEKAYQHRTEGVIYLKAQPYFDNLRSDSRREALLRRIGLD